MVRCVLSQLKPSGFSILSCEKGHGFGPFSQLRMESASDFILYRIFKKSKVNAQKEITSCIVIDEVH